MKNKKKVLMIGPARTVKGGVSAVVNNLYQAGLDKEVELRYLATMEDGSKFHKLWVAIKALCIFCLVVNRYEIVHVHMASDVSIYRKMVFIQIAYLQKKKIIIHQHGGNIEEFLFKKCKEKTRDRIIRSINKAEKLIVIAPYLQDLFKGIVDEKKIILLPNSVIIPVVDNKNYEQAKLLFLGRLCKEKGIKELLNSCERIRQEYSDLQLYLGGVWEEESLERLAESMNQPEKWIHYLGWIGTEKKNRFLQECNIFLLPSYFEGHPVSLLEGMAYGCACIATDIGGISQMITSGQNGLLIPIKDEDALYRGIKMYLSDSELQRRLGEAASIKMRSSYNIEKSLQQLLKVYEGV